MADGFPFVDRRQRPCVMGAASTPAQLAGGGNAPDTRDTPSRHRIDPARASARGRSYVDIAPMPGGTHRPHRDVLG